MPAAEKTVTIINQSGKIVGTTKTLVNVFKEARSAYAERKAEIKVRRLQQAKSKEKEQHIDHALKALSLQEETRRVGQDNVIPVSRNAHDESVSGRKSRHGASPQDPGHRPSLGRAMTDAMCVERSKDVQRSRSGHIDASTKLEAGELPVKRLPRRHTSDVSESPTTRGALTLRRPSLERIDMDLAYGEMPQFQLEQSPDVQIELRTKMTNLQLLLDECNCIQHSVSATIDNLQKNPDALAAVALTLAEISTLATKLAPGALASFKGAFPAVLALLASPQFAIAAGVGVGVTIIALGGYKIIKKIRLQHMAETDKRMLTYEARECDHQEEHIDELEGSEDELRELNKIELWRRGIADAEASSLGTSVDGEFITPHASKTLIEEGRLRESDLKSRSSTLHRRKKKVKSESTGRQGKEPAKSSRSNAKSKHKKERSGISVLFNRHRSD